MADNTFGPDFTVKPVSDEPATIYPFVQDGCWIGHMPDGRVGMCWGKGLGMTWTPAEAIALGEDLIRLGRQSQ